MVTVSRYDYFFANSRLVWHHHCAVLFIRNQNLILYVDSTSPLRAMFAALLVLLFNLDVLPHMTQFFVDVFGNV